MLKLNYPMKKDINFNKKNIYFQIWNICFLLLKIKLVQHSSRIFIFLKNLLYFYRKILEI